MFFNPWQTPNISQRNLPHWQQKGVIYFVTFRLADSIPASELRALREQRAIWSAARGDRLTEEEILQRDQLFSKQIDHWLDQGSGACWLKNPKIASLVGNALHFFDHKRYDLSAFVIMPNHVHLLLQPFPEYSLSKILHSLKSYTAQKINGELNREGRLWQEESYDRIVRGPEEFSHFKEYIRRNPEVAQVKLPEHAIFLR